MILPQDTVASSMDCSDRHSGLVVVVKVNRSSEKPRWKDRFVDRIFPNVVTWLHLKIDSTMRTLPFLNNTILLSHLSTLHRRQFIVVAW